MVKRCEKVHWNTQQEKIFAWLNARAEHDTMIVSTLYGLYGNSCNHRQFFAAVAGCLIVNAYSLNRNHNGGETIE
jgi:hypothetical protein